MLTGRIPRNAWIPGARHQWARLHLGLDPGDGGRRRRSGPPRSPRRALLPAHQGPATSQPNHPRRVGAHSLPRRRPVHLAARTTGTPVRHADGRQKTVGPGRRVGGGQLVARRRFAMGIRGRVRARHLADRPADGLRAGQHSGRHPHHSRRSGSGRIRAHHHVGRVRTHRRRGAVGRPRLPCRQLLAPDPLRGIGLCLPRARASFGPTASMAACPRGAGPQRTGSG